MREQSAPLYDGFTKITGEGNSAKITIRKPFLEALGIRKGDTVLCRVVDGALIVRPVRHLLEDISRTFAERDHDAVTATNPVSPLA